MPVKEWKRSVLIEQYVDSSFEKKMELYGVHSKSFQQNAEFVTDFFSSLFEILLLTFTIFLQLLISVKAGFRANDNGNVI